ncbi:DUF2182 domain-containing protein [Chthonobacter rhizosphaerae]|uniref:DUF2182 domain-containing protein n=1 Tax=Chthonobacter rhizosphaerae TaxID=2735553 RepID=UPI0015EFC41E|nr:DUF2182 domain-containing protein [Chthonobacter rhizosphaerae]
MADITPDTACPTDVSRPVADRLARHWRGLTVSAIALLALVGWAYLAAAVAFGGRVADMGFGIAALQPLLDRLAGTVPALARAGGGHGPLMPAMAAWGAGDVALVFVMWAAMVFAMMVPTAAPTFRAYARAGGATAGWVMAGYTAVWLAVAVVATLAQTALTTAGALAPHMAPAGFALSVSILIAAGLYQFTPLKLACLARCRRPALLDERPLPAARAFRLGIDEGVACLGCCWALMAVMFAAGLMNLVAMAFLGALMGTEKLAKGLWLTYAIGSLLLVAGLTLAAGSFLG